MTRKPFGLALIGFWLAGSILISGTALSGQAMADPGGSVTAARPGAAVRVTRTYIKCVLRCRTFVARKRCRPGTVCRFVTHRHCACGRKGARCYALCRSRVLVRKCSVKGWCRATVRRCSCYRLPVGPVPPPPVE